MKHAPEKITELIHSYLDGVATEEQSAHLNSRLRKDPEVRDLYLKLADIHSCLMVDENLWFESIPPSTRSDRAHLARHRWLAWPPVAATAAGILFGVFCTSALLAYVAPALSRGKVVFTESFESGAAQTLPGLPKETGVWAGDEASIVPSFGEFGPHTGGKMLRFISASYPGENSPRSLWSDVYRLVDVRGMAGTGRTVARVSASFAQDTVSAEERFAGRVEALAIDKEMSALPMQLTLAWLQQNNSAMSSRRTVLTTARSWQEVSVEMPITRETHYIMLHLAMVQEQPNIQSGVVKFAGHFMDDVKVEIVSRP